MQELISKEAVKEVFKTAIELPGARLYFHDAIEALPTTVHHEYKVGEEYEFADYGGIWYKSTLSGFQVNNSPLIYNRIRPLSAEHPDITQARELASKHGMILIPKE